MIPEDDWASHAHRDDEGHREDFEQFASRVAFESSDTETDESQEPVGKHRRPVVDYRAIVEAIRPHDLKNAERTMVLEYNYRLGWDRAEILDCLYRVPGPDDYPDRRIYREDPVRLRLVRRRKAAENAWGWIKTHEAEILAEMRRAMLAARPL
jgi:hypothetical protein